MAGKPGMVWSILTQKCPHCRRGAMFSNPNPWKLKEMTKMPQHCPVCGQLFELEIGFWYGTAYVSYLLTVVFSGLSFALWWLTLGFSLQDNRFFWWLSINGVLLLVLQPWFMRVSRALYLYFFVPYDEHYASALPKTFDYSSEDYFLKKEDPSK
ncbi:MAG: DUF983 domain-containing protein [Bacteroidota bacterium]|nr:DUF983 domain-containing protein [Bacteroidota bacterium]MDP4211281.1 DUF983 domain-containing protein [Bacteroidota bacterium]MDP4250030.1 DUF983 domain-containing protein [Bacteroidota bacterium]